MTGKTLSSTMSSAMSIRIIAAWLNGLVIDYGRQDQYKWIPKGCEYFGAQRSAAGIPHELRSFEGGHENQLRERIGAFMLPFLSERLTVE